MRSHQSSLGRPPAARQTQPLPQDRPDDRVTRPGEPVQQPAHRQRLVDWCCCLRPDAAARARQQQLQQPRVELPGAAAVAVLDQPARQLRDDVEAPEVLEPMLPEVRAEAEPAVQPSPLARDALIANWRAWAADETARGEPRDEAVRRLVARHDHGDPDAELALSGLDLTGLPERLPENLRWLNLGGNRLTAIAPPLPRGLQVLDLSDNRLSALPNDLPETIDTLRIGRNRLTHLPAQLPRQLRWLEVSSNALSELPALPERLNVLNLSNNQFTRLPTQWPAALVTLRANRNQLTALPDNLPDSLNVMSFSHNQLTELPERFPAALRRLNVFDNQLARLPETLPNQLRELHISRNRIARLPARLPAALESLWAEGNPVTALHEPLPSGLRLLNLTGSLVAALPDDLPPQLQSLQVSNSRLRALPHRLPDSLQYLNVSRNFLTRIGPLPASLRELTATHNDVTTLPQHWPARLERLNLTHNALTTWPRGLPPSLYSMSLAENALTTIPPDLDTIVPSGASVQMDNNPLNEEAGQALQAIAQNRDWSGPRLFFSMGGLRDTMQRRDALRQSPRPFAEVAAPWYAAGGATPGHALATTVDTAREQGDQSAEDFTRFLDKLAGTVNFQNPAFRAHVREWLEHLAANPALRAHTFALAHEATTSCEDRVSLTFNNMRRARLLADVDAGAYDARLPELLEVARGMFLLERLEQIARDKAASLGAVDEIEVYLAYQVHLRQRLQLPLAADDMRYFAVSYVTPDDLDRAEADLRAQENADFPTYLATEWAPWKTLMTRLDPERVAAANDRYLAAMGEPYQARVQAELAALNLSNDRDAEAAVGREVQREIEQEMFMALTQDFLRARGIDNLLAPRWEERRV
ncbi:Leucine-rich repeat (LRR) protein [Actimicrobium sp. GrIS 1.19]|uniref:NEL-type E3 ubiquitin ligase domain-containing protein n=1 Tax=Actimicrobium sp. GrIS 1.19 TaxID=3071708 RepID=UPI002E099D9B|nr:Leucine-rich repeat (LRR) protein [Actimicrobium sp. GrIS 1.19]